MSLRLIFIVDIHFRPIPILCKRREACSKISSASRINASVAQVHGRTSREKCYDHAGFFGLRCGLEQLYLPVPKYAFN
jgi:hypothetical protein